MYCISSLNPVFGWLVGQLKKWCWFPLPSASCFISMMYLKDHQHILSAHLGSGWGSKKIVSPQLWDQLAVTDATALVNLLQLLLRELDIMPQPHIMCPICRCSLSLLILCCFLQRAQNQRTETSTVFQCEGKWGTFSMGSHPPPSHAVHVIKAHELIMQHNWKRKMN